MRLNHLIELLKQEERPRTIIKTIFPDGSTLVSNPGDLDSWRGVYSQVSLEPDSIANGKNPRSTSELAAYLEGRIEQTMEGYKGGTYTIDGDSPVWSDSWGVYSGHAIVAAYPDPDDEDVFVLLRVLTPTHY